MQIPTALLNWHTPIGDESWWSVLELSKLDLSHNEFEGTLPDEMFVPPVCGQAAADVPPPNYRHSVAATGATICYMNKF